MTEDEVKAQASELQGEAQRRESRGRHFGNPGEGWMWILAQLVAEVRALRADLNAREG